MMYRDIAIDIKESLGFCERTTDGLDYLVRAPENRLVFVASSHYGVSYSLNPGEAIEGAKDQIDRALNR